MYISDHAVKRYKQRFGTRHMKAHKAREKIRNSIKKRTMHVHNYGDGIKEVITDQFRAVIRRSTVITITEKRDTNGLSSQRLYKQRCTMPCMCTNRQTSQDQKEAQTCAEEAQ